MDSNEEEQVIRSSQEDTGNGDYQYEELLERIYLGGFSDRQKTVMKLPVPLVARQGSKKTVHVNFMDFCKIMHRDPKYLASFMEMELATTLSLDEKQRLVVNGRFAPKHFEALLRRYAMDYVICHGCKSSDTNFSKENRIMFLRCEQCGSARSVLPVKQPVFHACTGRKKVGA
ncbi:eukaryotic translation initiation factor 2 subunit beta-like [Chenopodium quinoa]|nr:eukaryotic translation initiation factor 2 subunit beta-like [Chenopodium quinoa]